MSNCELADIEIHGKKFSTVSVTSGVNKDCDVVLNVDGTTLSNAVTYDHSATTIINTITPAFGSSSGGTEVILQGTNIGSAVTVSVDGVACTINSQNSTHINCTTGMRTSIPSDGNSMVIISDGNNVHKVS